MQSKRPCFPPSTMRPILFIIACAFFAGGIARGYAQTNAREQIRACASESIALSRSGQYEKYLDTVYPDAVQATGGREKMATMMKQAMDEIKGAGFRFGSTDVGEPTEPVQGGSKLFSVVPTKIHITSSQQKMEIPNYLLAISVDQGKSWKFLDGSGLSQATIKQLMPDFPSTLRLPEPQQPKVTPNS